MSDLDGDLALAVTAVDDGDLALEVARMSDSGEVDPVTPEVT